MNAQDVNVPDPRIAKYTAPPCCFKIEQRMKENRFKTDYKKKFHLEDVEIKNIKYITKLVDTYIMCYKQKFSV